MFRLLHCRSCNVRKIKINISEIKCTTCLFCTHSKSYYHTLGLDSTATPKEIKAAYYKLSLQFHPDKNNGCPESVSKFREITEAYEVLSNPEKKSKYDLKDSFPQYYHNAYSGRYRQPGNYYNGPFTGKTKDFNYDEHYKQHYQNVRDRRQEEFEYFRRRWEAGFYDRYPNFRDYYNRNREEEKQAEYEQFRQGWKKRTYPIYLIFGFWGAIFLFQFIDDMLNPEKLKQKHFRTIYYNTSNKKDTPTSD